MTTKKISKIIKVCYVLSYKSPNYTRTAALVTALESLPDVELTVIKNRSTGVVRYWQTLVRLIQYRLHDKPDVFILGFRGQEVFWFFYPFMRGSRIIFDEFINHHDWIVDEHGKFGSFGKLLVKLLDSYMRWVVRRCDFVLEDTPAHAALSRNMYHAPKNKIVSIPVGADELVFKPQPEQKKGKKFEVFFYGTMLPLHGFGVILDAINLLAADERLAGMHFTLAGGKGDPALLREIETMIATNKLEPYITHMPWVEYQTIPARAAAADVSLGGPFGGTGQAMRVVTGKTYQFMAVGAPVIIGSTVISNMFHDKIDCVMVDQNSPGALADALLWCQANPKELHKIGQNGRKLFEDKFSSKVIAQELNKMLHSINTLSSRPASRDPVKK